MIVKEFTGKTYKATLHFIKPSKKKNQQFIKDHMHQNDFKKHVTVK